MTDPQAASGTDRVAEVARAMPDIDIFVNVQGDEPEISGAAIDLAIDMLERHPERSCRRWPHPFAVGEQLEDPACVKVVCNRPGSRDVLQSQPDSAPARMG